jgi:hypothetical protein
MVKPTARVGTVEVTADGEGLVSRAGAALLVELADRSGLTAGLSGALVPTRVRRSAPDPGRVLRDVAVMLADGGDCVTSPPDWPRPLVHEPAERSISEADTALAGNLGTVILTGAITDHGRDHQGVAGGGTINKIVLSKGSFEINVGKLGSMLLFAVNARSCSSDGSARAPVTIVPGTGTGAYRGIGGTFETTATMASIAPRRKNGKCNTSATRYPGVLLATGSGTVALQVAPRDEAPSSSRDSRTPPTPTPNHHRTTAGRGVTCPRRPDAFARDRSSRGFLHVGTGLRCGRRRRGYRRRCGRCLAAEGYGSAACARFAEADRRHPHAVAHRRLYAHLPRRMKITTCRSAWKGAARYGRTSLLGRPRRDAQGASALGFRSTSTSLLRRG